MRARLSCAISGLLLYSLSDKIRTMVVGTFVYALGWTVIKVASKSN